ncbi:ABC transporter permease [Lacticigenium naphthae]|uniref:ABC transporter permease n=1 Tax=Lacticigenium naphthae TaxID=515351 RepID=UPI0004275370|nr:ABC transporter permease [Lacticigenium naphthae]
MSIEIIWKRRIREQYKTISRYLKYVFNDHFVLVLIFLMGGLGYSYSEYLKTLTVDSPWIKEGVLIILLSSIYIGRIATYIKEGDAVYLLPKEKQINETVLKNTFFSMIFPSLFLIILSYISMPVLILTSEITSLTIGLLFIILVLLKYVQLISQLLSMKLLSNRSLAIGKVLIFLGNIIVLYLSLYQSIITGLIFAIVFVASSSYLIVSKWNTKRMDWEKAIVFEKTRLYSIYRFINLFTDVSIVISKPKRRKYFDKLIYFFQHDSANVFYYLFLRVFFRTQTYSGLYSRLLVLTLVLLPLVDSFLLIVGFSIVSLYLIGFQLIPLINYFDEQSLLEIYPVQKESLYAALTKMLLYLLGSANISYAIVAFSFVGLSEGITIVLAGSLFIYYFIYKYTPKRLQIMMKR